MRVVAPFNLIITRARINYKQIKVSAGSVRLSLMISGYSICSATITTPVDQIVNI